MVKGVENCLSEGVKVSLRFTVTQHNAMDLPFDPRDFGTIVPMFDDPELALVVVTRADRSAHSPWRKVTG